MKRLWQRHPGLVTVACITFVAALILLGVAAWVGDGEQCRRPIAPAHSERTTSVQLGLLGPEADQ